MDVQEKVRATVEPVLAPLDVELVDVELVGSGAARVLRLAVDRDGGVDLDLIAELSGLASRALDADDPIPGRYTLEVSSPGVERTLRSPVHFRRVLGETVSVKTHDEVDGARRHQGVMTDVDDEGITLEVDGAPRRLGFDQVAQARTVFEWGPAPKPGKGGATKKTTTRKTTKTKV